MIEFEEVALTIEQRGLYVPMGFFDGHIIVDDDGDIEEIWVRTRTHDNPDNIVRLDPDKNKEPFEYEFAKRLREEVAEKYKFVIDEYVGDIRSSRRATAADRRNDQMWGSF